MQKCSLLLIPLLLWGCEQTFDNVIDSFQNNYQVSSVAGVKELYDLKNPADSLFQPRLIFAAGSEVNQVFFNILDPDNSLLNSSPVQMQEISENIYRNQFILKREYPNGKYTVNFSVKGFDDESDLVATSSFQFNNGQDNLSPMIANTVVDPDTAVVTQPTLIFTSVQASDPNGLNDIDEVYFIVFRPDSTTSGSKTFLFDDGNTTVNGDLVAGDGTFSRLIQVDETNAKGLYRFEFQAEDRSDSLSNIINHFVLIQ